MKLKLIVAFLICVPVITLAQKILPYQNPDLPVKERVNDLVSRMTLKEKVSQMKYDAPAIKHLDIPEYNWWNEALHGVARNGLATVFPESIGLAATWDTDLMYKVATVISDEARAKYNRAIKRNNRGIYRGLTFWSPNINIFRDPRWGRGMETYGEDPYLTGEMGLQFVKGMQGDNPKYLKTIATPKHFAVYSGPETMRHDFNVVVSNYDLRETYLPQFKKCIVKGNAFSVMCSYSKLRGEACCGNNPLLNKILRKEWGFKGYVVSDCWAVSDMYDFQKSVPSKEAAAAVAVIAGTDLNCGNSYPYLVDAVKKGEIPEKQIDESVKRLFTARFKLGMFDPPAIVPYSKLNKIDSNKDRLTALNAARESIVLLKNKNNLLPLNKNIKKIAVLGPNANDVEVLLGNYNGFPSHAVTPLQGIRNKLKNSKVIYERGCNVAEKMPSFAIIKNSFLYTSRNKKQHGLVGEYFNNRDFKGKPAFTRIDKKINFAWLNCAPGKKFNPDNFGVRWTGFIVPKKSGRYAIGGYGYNGFRIYIDDSLLVKYYSEFDPATTYNYINLIAGKAYKIKVEVYKKERYSFMKLVWHVPDDGIEQKAIEAVKNSDAVVMVMGLSPRLEGEQMKVNIKGFKGGDRTSLNLPETQENFIRKISTLGKPIVLVLLNGSALSVNWENKNIPAILEAWYPGEEAGNAIADVIFGDYNPGGKLPVTFYKSVNQLPLFTNYSMENRTYRYFKGQPLYPFGYGLSYTKFKFKNLKIDKKFLFPGDSTYVSVDLSNTGKLKGDEVVQLYIKAGKDTQTVKTLKGFKRVSLNPGETKEVQFKITPEKLSRWIEGKGFSEVPDKFTLMVGSSSLEKDLQKIDLIVQSKR